MHVPFIAARKLNTQGVMSQVSDGAAVALVTTRREAMKRGLPVLAVFRSFAAVGVDPAIMGVGPAVAIPAAVKQAGLTLDDIDVYEINEAFASQALYCVKELGIDPAKVWTSCCLLRQSVQQKLCCGGTVQDVEKMTLRIGYHEDCNCSALLSLAHSMSFTYNSHLLFCPLSVDRAVGVYR